MHPCVNTTGSALVSPLTASRVVGTAIVASPLFAAVVQSYNSLNAVSTGTSQRRDGVSTSTRNITSPPSRRGDVPWSGGTVLLCVVEALQHTFDQPSWILLSSANGKLKKRTIDERCTGATRVVSILPLF